MKILLVSTILMAASSVNTTGYSDYKCYLDTSIGKQLVLFSFKTEAVRNRLANLPATKLNLNGKKGVYVKDVIECVKESASFRNAKAKKLDKNLAR
ncbi:TapY2 family type IVa secretion system protein [Parashewanella tropica]|uniref:TapY2 family type IVa secretion system protein n=1 Tax=Parashewanella tropica TaxID=2547970 RepID=UPI00105A859D|nr:TapY2 family type IVa secretion system protein [Parashewanella tropica]